MKDKLVANIIESFIWFCILLVLAGALIVFCRTAMAFPSDWIEQCAPYKAQVTSILRSEGVSEDFYYLMVAESRCTQKAVSERGARGFWQLMPSTARHYGCTHPDELECATRAAAKYIKSLQSRFKDFDDVVAAYNMGGHNLKTRGMTKDAENLVYTVRRLRDDDKRSHQ